MLVEFGYDVRQFDLQTDLRTNIHLAHQVAAILCVDSFAFWLGTGLKKPTYTVLANSCKEPITLTPERYEKTLGTTNLVAWRENINDIKPEEIVDRFRSGGGI